jgi:endoglucanase
MPRPAVRINQLGCLPHGPKRATWVTEERAPVEFAVRDAAGALRLAGLSRPWPEAPEPTSGLAVHVLDFSALRDPGLGLTIVAGDARSHPFAIADGLYRDLARDALAFFYLQRSGVEIDEARAPGYGRPAGHPGDAAVPAWSGPDAERLYPGWHCPGSFDVSGGWYDAGDHGKYTTSTSLALWQLLATAELRTRRGTPDPQLLEECRWGLAWMLRMQVPPGSPHAGLAFHRVHGTEWAPLPCWPHADPTTRVLHRPSSAAALHLAAVAAQGARVLGDARLLHVAISAHRAAHAQPDLLAPDDAGAHGGGPYADADLTDDAYWAAAELWLATGDRAYARELRSAPADDFPLDGFDCDRVAAPAQLDLATGGDPAARASVIAAAERLAALQQAQPWGQPYAPPDGWDWGSNGRILNNLVVMAVAHELTGEPKHRDGALEGLDYVLGRNALGQSYVTGHGSDDSRHQRTRHFAHDLDPSFPPPPPGALAGGPTSRAHPGFPSDPRLAGLPPQRCYLDEPGSETTNDVCIRWNAPLVYLATAFAA